MSSSSTTTPTSGLTFPPFNKEAHRATKTTLDLTDPTITPRPITRIVKSGTFIEGGGFQVKRPFPTMNLSEMDPFLMLDHLGPKYYGPGEFSGAPAHPHRGFETVSYFLGGETRHTDSQGYSASMGPGWAQWMTAGEGVIHDERPTPAFDKVGGIVEGFQIWVNLTSDKKMKKPKYQDYRPERIPKVVVETPGRAGSTWANVIAGETFGVKSEITTESPIALFHYILDPGAKTYYTIPSEHTHNWNVGVYVIHGTGNFEGSTPSPTKATDGDLILYTRDAPNIKSGSDFAKSVIVIENASQTEELSLLVLGGQPLDEPIARRGPFVMNTNEQLQQAFRDFRDGKFGVIPPEIVA
ncbi:hypothetical protein HDU76_003643 [Blyttiomyces sp. JEL0837]|nr:hypothetical protein HDU76_003643 [Blyttiomyces sp. JEL0837]